MAKPSNRKTILITAGPTIEPIDPVRFISNYSTGEMGYALAAAAKRRGNRVVLVSGPTALSKPGGVKFVPVVTALEMKAAVERYFKAADCVIMTAAVADFRPAGFSGKKVKKKDKKRYILRLSRNPDILAALGRRKGSKILVGFSLETDDCIKNAKAKLKAKNLDIVVANNADKKRAPFGKGMKDFILLCRKSPALVLKAVSKQKISHILLDKIDILW